MNTILGGMFQSRLNANIREEKGYSYGVNSFFGYGKGPGPSVPAETSSLTKSDAALVEFIKELRGILGERPVTEEELKTAKDSLVQRLPGHLRRSGAINGALTVCGCNRCPIPTISMYTKSSRRSQTRRTRSRRNMSIWIIWPSWLWEIARRSKRLLAQPRSRRSFTWISMAPRSMVASYFAVVFPIPDPFFVFRFSF